MEPNQSGQAGGNSNNGGMALKIDRFPTSLQKAYFYFGLVVGTGSALAWIEQGLIIGKPWLWSVPELLLAGIGWMLPIWVRRKPSILPYVLWIPTILLASTFAKIVVVAVFSGITN